MSWLKDFTKVIELKTKLLWFFFAGWIFGALIIFLPNSLKQQMAVATPETARPWIGFMTLAAFVLWLVLAIIQIFAFLQRKHRERRIKVEVLCQLETLSQGEREIFLVCLYRNQRTIRRNMTDGAINSLAAKRLVVVAPQGSILAMPYTIPKFVWDYIKANESELFPELHDEAVMRALEQGQRHAWMGL